MPDADLDQATYALIGAGYGRLGFSGFASIQVGEYTALACVTGIFELEALLEAVFHHRL